jgi:hypothetical protein
MSAAQGAEAAWTEHRPTRHHIAYLGGILQDDVRHAERRVEFWAKATAKLDGDSASEFHRRSAENLRRR